MVSGIAIGLLIGVVGGAMVGAVGVAAMIMFTIYSRN